MKDFARARSRLRNLPLQARLVYSIFLVFTLAGLALTAWLTHEMVGLSLAGVDAYYAGTAAPPARPEPGADASAAAGGPQLELPPELDGPPPAEPMALRKLLEVTHFHLFSMPVYLMILSHLFMLSRIGSGTKSFFIGLGTLAVLAHMAAPWLARSGGAAAFYGASGAALALSFLVMCVVPLLEMWRPVAAATRPPQT